MIGEGWLCSQLRRKRRQRTIYTGRSELAAFCSVFNMNKTVADRESKYCSGMRTSDDSPAFLALHVLLVLSWSSLLFLLQR